MSRDDFETNDEAGAAAFEAGRGYDDREIPDLSDLVDRKPTAAEIAAAFEALPVEDRRELAARIQRDRDAHLARLDAAADARHAARQEARR